MAVEDSPYPPLNKGGWGDLSDVLHSSETRYKYPARSLGPDRVTGEDRGAAWG
jgi:hypothetical protein